MAAASRPGRGLERLPAGRLRLWWPGSLTPATAGQRGHGKRYSFSTDAPGERGFIGDWQPPLPGGHVQALKPGALRCCEQAGTNYSLATQDVATAARIAFVFVLFQMTAILLAGAGLALPGEFPSSGRVLFGRAVGMQWSASR